MKFLQVTTIISPHQMPVSRCLVEKLGSENYRYAATSPIATERVAMGWECSSTESWILNVADDSAARKTYHAWWDEADVVFCATRDLDLLVSRVNQKKLTIYYSERWWKPPIGMLRMLHPGFARMGFKFRNLLKQPDFHYLPIGHFAGRDMARLIDRTPSFPLWGYFPAIPATPPTAGRNDSEFIILNAGRMLAWKNINILIRAFAFVHAQQPSARLRLIGDGPEREKLARLVETLNLTNVVSFETSKPMAEIWHMMSAAHVFVLPSNGYEGWGAVVNEAMTYGCAVVASDATGSGVSMIQDHENGRVFRSGDWKELGRILLTLAQNPSLRNRLAANGQAEIYANWSPEVAADRLIAFCAWHLGMNPGYTTPHNGPLSPYQS